MITPADAHAELKSIYEFYAIAAPGVPVVEHGRVAQLWRHIDMHTDPETGEEYE